MMDATKAAYRNVWLEAITRHAEAGNLTGPCVAVATALWSYMGPDGQCWPGVRAIGARSGLGNTAVRDALHRLEAAGLIGVARVPGRGSTYHAAVTPVTSAPGDGAPGDEVPRETARRETARRETARRETADTPPPNGAHPTARRRAEPDHEPDHEPAAAVASRARKSRGAVEIESVRASEQRPLWPISADTAPAPASTAGRLAARAAANGPRKRRGKPCGNCDHGAAKHDPRCKVEGCGCGQFVSAPKAATS